MVIFRFYISNLMRSRAVNASIRLEKQAVRTFPPSLSEDLAYVICHVTQRWAGTKGSSTRCFATLNIMHALVLDLEF